MPPFPFDPTKNKNIVICCDGTWNSPEQTDRGQNASTNVVRMYEAVDADLSGCGTPDGGRVPQIRWYDEGIGAELGSIGRLLSLVGRLASARAGGTVPGLNKLGVLIEGATGLGISQNIREAYAWLSKVYVPGDRIFLFGFSRGAFEVRSLTGLLHHVGLLRPEFAGRTPEAYARYRNLRAWSPRANDAKPRALLDLPSIHDPDRFRVHFLGVWDTVAALGLPMWGWSFELFRIRTRFHDTSLVPIVDRAFHALAMDEQRSGFMPVLLTPRPGMPPDGFDQRWFRGAHADVGGGYFRSGLSDIALGWMAGHAERAGLRFRDGAWSGCRPDVAAPLHDEASRRKSYVFAGIWPRMFPLAAEPPAAEFGDWHGSVADRRNRIERFGFVDWLARMPATDDIQIHKGDTGTEGWDLPSPDPRESGWSSVPAGGTRSASILAGVLWNPTGIVLEANVTYRLTATGAWRDLSDPTGPGGRTSLGAYLGGLSWRRPWALVLAPRAIFGWAKRRPSAPWMQLVGMVNPPTNWERRTYSAWWLLWFLAFADPRELTTRQFAIGEETVFTPARTGPLYAFANDMWGFYGNNSGAVTLTVERARGDAAAPAPARDVLPGILSALAVAAAASLAVWGGYHLIEAAWPVLAPLVERARGWLAR